VSSAASGKERKTEMTDFRPPSNSEKRQDEKWYDRTRYQVLLFVGGIVLFVLVGGWILDWYINPHTSGQKKDLVQSLGLLTAGVAGVVGIFLTWRGQRITQDGQHITQESLQDTRVNSEEYLRLAREGQITERFTRAIDQLGATNNMGNKLFEIRLGGIYALERIARESAEDYWPIMEILTAYVRQNGHWPPEEIQQAEEDAAAEKKAEEDSSGESKPAEAQTPDLDIQAIITVLRRRTNFWGQGEPEGLWLQETNLSGVDLGEAHLSGAALWDAKLSETFLVEADLSGANLTGADLTGAALPEADFTGVNLFDADLTGANLGRAKNLTRAQLEETKSGDEKTQLPPDLKPPAHWNVKIDEQNEGD
jgi:hypothetical protein